MELKRILILDDDPHHLEQLREALEGEGHVVFPALNVKTAALAVQAGIDFAIVDLFLEGDDGDELSNDFISDTLIPRGIAYARMSSAPGLVPKHLSGCGVYDKRSFRANPSEFLRILASDWLAGE